MAFVRLISAILGLSLWLAMPLSAQKSMPEHRFIYTRDVDFFGSDLSNLFDTSLEGCERACAAEPLCVAFTFNTRKNACFPKSDVIQRQTYAGALSALKKATDPEVRAQAPMLIEDLAFLAAGDLAAAHRLVGQTARRFPLEAETVDDMIAMSELSAQKGETLAALRWAGKAVAASDTALLWNRYAALAMVAAQDRRSSDRTRFRAEAVSAAINGYLRAKQTPMRVATLETLARTLEQADRGRDMIPVLRLAQTIGSADSVAQALDNAIAKYGFRVIDHRVDNDAAAPRICVVFSEKLIKSGLDYEPFVRIEGRGLTVGAEGEQLCIDGVTHGAEYVATLRAGLPSVSGEKLQRDVRLKLYVRDRRPSARFPGRAYVLPRSATAALPVETVNVDTLDLKLRRVSDRNLVRAIREDYFGRPLSRYQDDLFAADLAEEIWTGQGDVNNDLNVDMTTRLPLGSVLAEQPVGIYALSAAVPGQDPYENPAATQWFVLSDLGLSSWSGVDGLHIAVRRLGDATAAPGVVLTLVSQANAVLGQATTDSDGFADFAAGITRGTGAAAPALLMAEDASGDIGFLPLTDPAFDLSDRGVEGNPPSPPIDAFLTTDRGAYRVGETVFATALLRDPQGNALTGLPVTAILKRPDGVEYSRSAQSAGQEGGHVFDLPLGQEVPRGAWRLDVHADLGAPALASQVVLVEDFLPERIDFEIDLPDVPLPIDSPTPVSVAVRYLFGAPGANLRVEGDLRLRAVRNLSGWDGYVFGRHDAQFTTLTHVLNETQTDAAGQALMNLSLPEVTEDPGQPLTAEIILRVAEGSGRPVERRMTKPVQAQKARIGIKSLFDETLPEGAEAAFNLLTVAPDGQAMPVSVTWTLNRIETRYHWYQLYGDWQWEPTTRRTRIDSGTMTLGAAPASLSVPTAWGDYELVVQDASGAGGAQPASVRFSAGWYGSDTTGATPDRLEVSLNQTTFDTGDVARLRVMSPGDGVALISVLSNRVIARHVVEVSMGENVIPLNVTKEWGSGAYVTASVLRPMAEADGIGPSRALGLVHAAVRSDAHMLDVSILAPDVVDGQAGRLRTAVQVDGIAAGETAFVTLAAVDVGILNLTGFKAPDPTEHYFGQRRLGVEIRDLYGRLIDGLNGFMGVVRSGGDALAAAQIQAPPPTEELMAFFAGPVEVGPDGRAMIDVVRPGFNGTIRLMAVAWSPSGIGEATTDVVARDPVVLTASLPRFLAPGDNSRLLLEFTRPEVLTGTAPSDIAQRVALSVVASDALTLGAVPEWLVLDKSATIKLEVPVKAGAIGDHGITIAMALADGTTLTKVLTLPVRDNDPEIAVTRQFALDQGTEFTFDTNVFAGMRANTASATLAVGPLARFDVPGLLRQLDRYPYGCTEQLTSGALPLLYLSGMAQGAGLGPPTEIDDRIADAIARILTRQTSGGGFGMWSARSGEFWLDAYVSDFLSRARAAGHVVPDRAFALAMDNLRNRISYAPDFDSGGEYIAYALLVLAREGAASMGDLRYYADTKATALATPMAAAQLGAALAAYGDPQRADALFRQAAAMLDLARPSLRWRDDYGSPLRDAAAVLSLSAEAGSTAVDRVSLARRVVGTGQTPLSTQEAAQVALAAHAMAEPGAVPGLLVDGSAAQGPIARRLPDRDRAPVRITNAGAGLIDVTLTTYGVPDVAPAAGGYGYALKRAYYDMQGNVVSDRFATGDRMVVVLTVTPFEDVGARLILDDPLPAGFEIDNPNLLQSGSVAALDWLDPAATEHAEFRADRFIAALDHRGAAPFTLAYVVRAVTPGRYHHPAATVTDMYRPEYRARTATGVVQVTP